MKIEINPGQGHPLEPEPPTQVLGNHNLELRIHTITTAPVPVHRIGITEDILDLRLDTLILILPPGQIPTADLKGDLVRDLIEPHMKGAGLEAISATSKAQRIAINAPERNPATAVQLHMNEVVLAAPAKNVQETTPAPIERIVSPTRATHTSPSTVGNTNWLEITPTKSSGTENWYPLNGTQSPLRWPSAKSRDQNPMTSI